MRTAKDIMTRSVITVTPDTSVKEVARLLLEHHINGMPVVGDRGEICGVVTEGDLVDQNKKLHIPTVVTLLDSFFLLESPDRIKKELKKMAGTTAGQICSTDVVTVDEETPVDEVATLMAEKHINTIPVLKDGKLTGIIGRGDIVRSFTS
ncbi:MAG TPA: CBS domain-containing protein [Thermodesulfobacteriaceae bacterium]|nr:CBS domain-containing protein [Thermodesulfobacteriaceae bacterium]